MGFILSLVSNKKTVVVVLFLLCIAAMAVYIKILKANLSEQTALVESYKVQLQVSQASVSSLRSSLDEQNSAIDKLRVDADNRAVLGAAKIRIAEEIADKYRTTSVDLLRRTIPDNKTPCEAADSLINEEITRANR